MDRHRTIPAARIVETLMDLLGRMEYDSLFVLADEHTEQLCVPQLREAGSVKDAYHIVIGAGDCSKNVETLTHVWDELAAHGATRHSLLLNVGGGMVTDLGGFAAATFKRGIRYVNIPTTLLAMVDAAVGGKTGVNFHSLKNEIGAFYPAEAVLIATSFLSTLDGCNLRSGFAEMLKHGLISDEAHWARLMGYDLEKPDYSELQELVMESIRVKEHIVAQDPTERHLRKALNLGHTLGHAFETMAMLRGEPCLHGYAVAWGLVGELYLSHIREGFAVDKLRQTVAFVKSVYGMFVFDCTHYEQLYELMQHDKKNVGSEIRFTLLGGVGDVRIDRTVGKEEIFEMLDFVREC